MAETLIGACAAILRAEANRAANGAMSVALSFDGLPGGTSHHTSSSPSASIAARLIARCPECAGLNEPPRRPMRIRVVAVASRAWRVEGAAYRPSPRSDDKAAHIRYAARAIFEQCRPALARLSGNLRGSGQPQARHGRHDKHSPG